MQRAVCALWVHARTAALLPRSKCGSVTTWRSRNLALGQHAHPAHPKLYAVPQGKLPTWLLAFSATTAKVQRPGGSWPTPPPTLSSFRSLRPFTARPSVPKVITASFSE